MTASFASTTHAAPLPAQALEGTYWIETLRDGTRVLIRPLRAEDHEREEEFIRQMFSIDAADNEPMRELARHPGFERRLDPDDGAQVIQTPAL